MSSPWYLKPPTVRRLIFVYELAWFVALLGLAFAYFRSDTLNDWVPDPLGGLPVEVAWFGALGGITISLRGIFEHAAFDENGKSLWADGWPLWYIGRPFSGLIAGIITLLLLKAIYPSGQPTAAVVLAGAFILGTQENRFFAFLAQVGALIIAIPNSPNEPGKQNGGS